MTDTPQDQSPNPASDEEASEEVSESIAITTDEILVALRDGEIETDHGMLRWSSNYTFLITIRYEEMRIPAVYKPRRGERPLWDFPDGTLCNREVASHLTSEELGWQIVPPTVLREGSHGIGSVQFYIDHDPNENYFSFDISARPFLARIALFDVLVNNADRKGGHCLLDAQGHIWGIDHGITFHDEHKLRTVIWDFAKQTIPDVLLADIEQLCEKLNTETSDFRQQLCNLLSPREINAFERRVQHVLETKQYPTPGPGPNYPWPAI